MKPAGVAELLDRLPEASAVLSRRIIDAAETLGIALYAVGGPVRDLLLARELRDVDLVVDGVTVDPLLEVIVDDRVRLSRHDRFGVYQISDGEVSIDLARARRESYPHPGSLPRVEDGSLEEDLARRDFGINALALPLTSAARRAHPEIVDFADGVDDLEHRCLRVLHDQSFHDDPTRAFRAARLSARLGFSLTRGSRSALRAALRDGAFGRVSGDRLRREFTKLVDDARFGTDPSRSLRCLSDWHVLGVLEPGLSLPKPAVAPIRRIGRCVANPPWSAPRWRPWVSVFSVWLAAVDPALRRRTLGRFSVRGDGSNRIATFAKSRDGWLRAVGRARGRGAIDAVLAPLSEEDLHALFACAEPTAQRRIQRWAAEDRNRRNPLSGEDLLAIGIDGPAVGRALIRIRTAFLDGAIANRDDALALAREVGQRHRATKKRTRKPKRKPDRKSNAKQSRKTISKKSAKTNREPNRGAAPRAKPETGKGAAPDETD